MKGWLPVKIGLDVHPAAVSEAAVRWVEFGSTPLDEPFFTNTIAKLRKGDPPAREIDTDLDTLMQASSGLSEVRPTGFIFHISHCGSTLLANALKTASDVLVVSEPPAATGMLLPRASVAPDLDARWNRTRETLLRSVFALLAHYRTGDPERLVIKFPSINTLSMRLVRSIWPDTRCVVVVRDPAEVIVSSLRGGGWMPMRKNPDFAREILGWQDLPVAPEEMPMEEYSARVLGKFFSCAIESLDERCMVIDYEDLKAARIREAAAFLGIALPEKPEDLDDVMRVYSKDPTKGREFHGDRAAKQSRAGAEVRDAARRWAMDGYCELRGSGA